VTQGRPLKLRAWRISRALSQEELGRRAQVQRSTLARIEEGKQFPRPSTLRKIALALDLDPAELFRDPS
jgi:transcriptional regulator with XRE-family HTH domain